MMITKITDCVNDSINNKDFKVQVYTIVVDSVRHHWVRTF